MRLARPVGAVRLRLSDRQGQGVAWRSRALRGPLVRFRRGPARLRLHGLRGIRGLQWRRQDGFPRTHGLLWRRLHGLLGSSRHVLGKAPRRILGPANQLRHALASYCTSVGYLRQMLEGATRIGLDRQPAGVVTAGAIGRSRSWAIRPEFRLRAVDDPWTASRRPPGIARPAPQV